MTAATTESELKLLGMRNAARLVRRLLLCALAFIMCAPQIFAQTKPVLPVQEKTIESLLTNAGTLSIVQLGDDTDLKMELRLKDRKVYAIEGNMSAGFIAHFRTYNSGEIIVMTVSEGGSACPAQFQIIHIEDSGKISVTEEFGDCGDSPTITLQQLPEDELTLRFQGYYRLSEENEPGFKKPPPSTWVFKKGVLRQLNTAPVRRGK